MQTRRQVAFIIRSVCLLQTYFCGAIKQCLQPLSSVSARRKKGKSRRTEKITRRGGDGVRQMFGEHVSQEDTKEDEKTRSEMCRICRPII